MLYGVAEDEHVQPVQPPTCNAFNYDERCDYGPHSAFVPCHYLPMDFLECEELIDHHENATSFDLAGVGCLRFGGQTGNGMS